MVPEAPPIQRKTTGQRPGGMLTKASMVCAVGVLLSIGLTLRGCMTEHSRPVGHGDITFDISPDGRSLVFAGVGDGGRDLYLLDLSSLNVTQLTSSRDYEICPTFSQDGGKVAFTRGAPYVRADQLCVIDLSTRKIEQMTDADENVSSPVFFPNGKKILCTVETQYRWGGLVSSWDEGGELRIIDAQTRKQITLKNSPSLAFKPRLSANGKWIAWVQNGAYVSPMTDPIKASQAMPRAASLSLSADGTKLAASMGEYSPDLKIYIADRKGKNHRLISGSVGGCFDPVFSPDGKYVYFLSEAWLSGGTGVPIRNLMRASTLRDEVVEIASYELFEEPLSFTQTARR